MNAAVESGLRSCDLGIECLMKGLQVIGQTRTGSLCTLKITQVLAVFSTLHG